MQRNGFSLVELSIVLVILGLLTGGILAGQALIRASEIRSVSTEYGRFTTALHSFRDKYSAYPGDINNATSFWGKDNASCPAHTGTAATPGTCNGNGDGTMIWTGSPNYYEAYRIWQHLTLAGLIEGSYTGIQPGAGPNYVLLGVNSPQSRLTNAGWSTYYRAPGFAGNTEQYALDYGNHLVFGALRDSWTYPTNPALRPEEAWNIDTKIDDGKPGMGKMVVHWWNNLCARGGASQSDLTNSVYNLTDTTPQCALYFVKIF